VLLNMNRCIQCTRCVRFTREISGTGSLGFFNRGARTEIGTFPGQELDDPLAGNVVDVCPVGALTSTRFRFAERVWYLDKKPSLCTGCEVGCNVTLEHRGGAIRRYKPRANPEVNDYWLCDFGRASHERYGQLPRLLTPRIGAHEDGEPATWAAALDAVHHAMTSRSMSGAIAFLGSAHLSTEAAYALAQVADHVGSPHRAVWVDAGPERSIPNTHGGISGSEAGPNRRGAELAGLASREGGMSAEEISSGTGAERCAVLVVADSDLGEAAHDPESVERLRRASFLVVLGWADTPLARAADVALPVATHAETGGTFINVEWRLQRFERAFPAPGQARPAFEALADLLSRFDEGWSDRVTAAEVFDRLATEAAPLAGLRFDELPATGQPLEAPRETPEPALEG
jgi:NADH-quinone oxidoreductase subunit G